ncbi:hypothetical protein KSP39_PZI009648 [Platanthera zijinensis]|uniref:Syntaxin-5 N-terminal Sly1p-binding domain-containing protein n=1 Tax=Platanthera zijinensis TaxID=2320716 RepID=A0AAP0G862_9ASPA
MHPRSGQYYYRDRTQEFLTIAERLRKSLSSSPHAQSSINVGSKPEGLKSAVNIQSEFNAGALRIGLGI